MGVACQILINKKKEGIHRAGQEVTGVVKFAFDTPAAHTTIILSLLGTGECSWSETDSDNQSTKYTGSEKYITSHQNILNKKTGTANFDVGSYEYPFTFRLPRDLPSSFKNSSCTIAYRIQLKFNNSQLFKLSKKFVTEIPVYGYIEPTTEGPVIFGLEKTLMKLLSSDKPIINLKAEIAKTYLIPGENSHLTLTVTNSTDVEPTVRTDLCCYTTYIADSGRTSTTCLKFEDCCTVKSDISKRSVTNLSQIIPTRAEFYSITCKVMRKEYKLRVTLRLPFPHVNAVVEMPLLVGEREGLPTVDGAVEVLEESSSVSLEDVEGPPSYWEAMCENK